MPDVRIARVATALGCSRFAVIALAVAIGLAREWVAAFARWPRRA
jgi:hypothetical protein